MLESILSSSSDPFIASSCDVANLDVE
jgi:hypothetical protein